MILINMKVRRNKEANGNGKEVEIGIVGAGVKVKSARNIPKGIGKSQARGIKENRERERGQTK